MTAYAADQTSVTSSVGSGDIIRWVSRIPVRPDAVSVRQAVPEPPSQPYPPGMPVDPAAGPSPRRNQRHEPQPLWSPRNTRTDLDTATN